MVLLTSFCTFLVIFIWHYFLIQSIHRNLFCLPNYNSIFYLRLQSDSADDLIYPILESIHNAKFPKDKEMK